MKTLTVGILKSRFSDVIHDIKDGEEYTIEYGKKHEKVAVILPYSKYKKNNGLKLGLLKNKGSISLSKNFKIDEDEFLGMK